MTKKLLLTIILWMTALPTGCRGGESKMIKTNEKSWNVGRFELSLPTSSSLVTQTQELDGIVVTYDGTKRGQTLTTILNELRSTVQANPHTPFIALQKWGPDSGGVLYVMDDSNPDYYKMTGRRVMPEGVLLADTDGSKSKVDLIVDITRELLTNYYPGDFAPASFDRFGMASGSLHQKFRNAEEMHIEFLLPESGTRLWFDTTVVQRPVQVDLFKRTEQTMLEAKAQGLVFDQLRKTHSIVAGQSGEESMISDVSRKQRQYDVRLETPGVAGSASQPRIAIRFFTEDIMQKPLDEKQFTVLWESIRNGIKVAP